MDYPVPGYLMPVILTGMITIITAILLGLRNALRRSTWPEEDRTKAFWSVSALLVGWFVIAVATSMAGFYRPPSGPPTIQYGLLLPIVVGVVLFRTSPLLRRTLAIIPNSWLVGVQFYRALGIVFLALYAGRHLPGLFALPAGVGDVFVGIFAPSVAASLAGSAGGAERRARFWNLLGIADLVIAVTIGFLTSPSPLQIAAFDRPSVLIAMFPLALIPVFAVPLSLLLHIASLKKLSQDSVVGSGKRLQRVGSSSELKTNAAHGIQQ